MSDSVFSVSRSRLMTPGEASRESASPVEIRLDLAPEFVAAVRSLGRRHEAAMEALRRAERARELAPLPLYLQGEP